MLIEREHSLEEVAVAAIEYHPHIEELLALYPRHNANDGILK
jgi:hypothetical protein